MRKRKMVSIYTRTLETIMHTVMERPINRQIQIGNSEAGQRLDMLLQNFVQTLQPVYRDKSTLEI